jgi:phosphatidylserine/phosphatidylglycerophosphate/cardiolipin synthase-like enzyme
MPRIVQATAYANNEVGFLAWRVDTGTIPGCLGFHIVREHLDDHDMVILERPLAAYVAFKGQSNPDWQAQNTSIWPIQKFNWRDLTLRRRRDASGLRPEGDRVRYRIRAVGRFKVGMEPVLPIPGSHEDPVTHQSVAHVYEGTPIKLGYLTGAATTNVVTATRKRGPFTSTFTNGILSTQFLVRAMEAQGLTGTAALETALKTPGNAQRNMFAGDVLTTIQEFFAPNIGRFHAALYELNDVELIALLKSKAKMIDLILSDAGANDTTKTYDTTNDEARAALRAIASAPGSKFTLQDRLFNGTGHIGHNKFVIWSDAAGVPRSVLTGSTNWTWSGVCGQSNNCIRIDNDDVARAFKDYWLRLHADALAIPAPLSAANKGANQGDALKTANRTPDTATLANGSVGNDARVRIWFSPNMPGKQQPPPASAPPQAPPPDLEELFSLMRKAEKAILFAVFLPSIGGKHSIIEQAVQLGLGDSRLNVIGAVSDSQAMWRAQVGQPDATGQKAEPDSPYFFESGGIRIARAAALTDKTMGGKQIGNFVNKEILTLGKAIIHDKIIVIDPLDPVNSVVAFGSHNMGYKASYSNDENMVIVRGHKALAEAYTVHVLDIFDHYRFRAKSAQMVADAKKSGTASHQNPQWDGFLDRTDKWQAKASRALSDYFAP